MPSCRIRIHGAQSVERLPSERRRGATEIEEKVRIVRQLRKSCLQIRDCLRSLARLQLRDTESSGVVNHFQVRNGVGCVTRREERISEQLMDSRRIRTQFGCVLQGRNGRSVVMLLHVCVAQPQEDDYRVWRQFRGLTKRGDGLVKSTAIFSVNAGLQQWKRI